MSRRLPSPRPGRTFVSRRTVLGCLGAAGFATAPFRAQASDYPQRPIRIVAPFSAGSAADAVARRLADGLKKPLGTAIVENVTGAGGMIGAASIKKSDADGYTLFIGSQGIHVLNPMLYKKLSYDPAEDFTPITNLTQFPSVIVAAPALGVKTLADFVALAKSRAAEGKPLTYGFGGVGTSSHLGAELLKQAAAIELTGVAYKAVSDTAIDVLASRLDLVVGNINIFEQHVKAGNLAALAVTAPRRVPILPEVPNVAELGFAQAEIQPWLGLFVRSGTPEPLVERIGKAAIEAYADPTLRERFAAEGVEVVSGSRAEFEAFIAADRAKWRPIIEKLNISL